MDAYTETPIIIADAANHFIGTVHLTNLLPGTSYEYKIKINLNTKKKTAHEIFADIIISHNETIAGEGLAKNFHY